MADPLVSVVVPVYNGARYIKETIDSLLVQTLTTMEVIVVDDGSSDGTKDILSKIPDRRIRVVTHENNRGLAEARNTGIRAARGFFIAMQDGDDIAEPEWLTTQVRAMERDSNIVYVGCQAAYIDESSRLTGKLFRTESKSDELSASLLFRNRFIASGVMVRRSMLPDGLYCRDMPMAEDYLFAVRMERLGRVVNSPDYLERIRRHSTSMTYRKQALMTECVSRVHRLVLENFGLTPSDRDLEVHQNVGRHLLPGSESILRESEAWLLRLTDCNNLTGRYDRNIFDELLSKEWFELCCYSSGVGFQAWRLYWRSALSRKWRPNFIRQIKFLMKCLLKHQRAAGDVPLLPAR